MIQPKSLQKNDTVAIVSTARKISLAEIENAIKLLKNWGLNVLVGKTIGLEDNQFAGTDAERTEDFQAALNNPKVKAIWCARGGYGTVRIIDNLDFSTFLKQPKWIIGYSDITVLHSHIHNLGVETLHATMPLDIGKTAIESTQSLKKALFNELIKYKLPTFELNVLGNTSGQLVGGNLSILNSLLGSKSSITTKDKILFIEDLDEYLYHIDRMMQNLKRNGYFNNLNGLLVGGMSKMNDNAIPFGKTAEEIVYEIVKDYSIPVAFGVPSGHILTNNTLILGRKINLTISEFSTEISF